MITDIRDLRDRKMLLVEKLEQLLTEEMKEFTRDAGALVKDVNIDVKVTKIGRFGMSDDYIVDVSVDLDLGL